MFISFMQITHKKKYKIKIEIKNNDTYTCKTKNTII